MVNKVFNQLEQCVWEQLCAISNDQLEKEVLDHNFGDLSRIMLPIEDEDLNAAKKRFQVEIFYSVAEERIINLKNKSSKLINKH